MRESPCGDAEYVRGRPFPVGSRVVAFLMQGIKLAEVDVPGKRGLPLFVGGAVGPESADVLDVVVRGNVRNLGGLDEGVEEHGGVLTIDGLYEDEPS